MDAELGLGEHLRLEIEEELAVAQVERSETEQGSLQGDGLQGPGQLRLAGKREEHVGVAEGRVGRATGKDLVTEYGELARPDDGLEERRYPLAADDVAHLTGELLLALLLPVAHAVG